MAALAGDHHAGASHGGVISLDIAAS